MADRIRGRLKNQGVSFTRGTAKLQLERVGVRLSSEWTRQRDAEPSTDASDAPQPLHGLHLKERTES
jgi:hypothetical protein